MDYYAIGRRIRTLRREQNLSQELLAEKAGISTVHMSHIETGSTKLSLPVLVELAKALDVSVDRLLQEDDSSRGELVSELARALSSCTEEQVLILKDILFAARDALNRYGK